MKVPDMNYPPLPEQKPQTSFTIPYAKQKRKRKYKVPASIDKKLWKEAWEQNEHIRAIGRETL
jgi:hypothetical protein